MNGRFGIDFFLTKTCNQQCYYCTSFTKEQRNLTVDIGFLENVMQELNKFKIENVVPRLLGGEPGLVKNLDEVIKTIQKYNVKRLEVYSNSMVRKTYPFILSDPNIHYMEHMFYKINNKQIKKLGDFEFHNENSLNNFNIVVLTNDFIMEYKDVDLSKLMHKNTIWKMVNDRSPIDKINASLENQYKEFQNKIIAKDLDVSSANWQLDKLNDENRLLCSIHSPSPVINFEDKTIHHCSKTPLHTKKVPFTTENIRHMFNGTLFNTFPNYCKVCKEPALSNRLKRLVNCKNKNYIN